jgi:prepilin-type processing-associated H-X9-DG protein
MNAAIGNGDKSTDFKWLTFVARKMGDLHTPGPSDSWLFTDEHPDSIDDAALYSDPGSTNGIGQFTELPSSDHAGACGLGFADGHAEIHRWRDARTVVPVGYDKKHRIMMSTYNQDLAYIATRTPRAR